MFGRITLSRMKHFFRTWLYSSFRILTPYINSQIIRLFTSEIGMYKTQTAQINPGSCKT